MGDHSEALYQFLHWSPIKFNYELPVPASVETEILKRVMLHFAAGREDYFELLFKSDTEQHRETKACGYVFKKGEAVYSCL